MTKNLNNVEIADRLESLKIPCGIDGCGYRSWSLSEHLRVAHKLNVIQYKKKFPDAEYPIVSPLASYFLERVSRHPHESYGTEERVSSYFGHFASFTGLSDLSEYLEAFSKHRAAVNPYPEYAQAHNPHFVFTPVFMDVFYGIIHQANTYLEGYTGTGKTDGILQIFYHLNKPVYRVNFNGQMTPEDLLGSEIINSNKEVVFREGILPTCMRKGVPILFDEVDFLPPFIQSVLYSVLDKRTLFLPATNETVVATDGFFVLATANTSGKGDNVGHYTGTEVLNSALLDRFPIKATLEYLPVDKEAMLLNGLFPKHKKEISTLVKVAEDIRHSFMTGAIVHTLSTRKLVQMIGFAKDLGLKKAFDLTFLNWFKGSEMDVINGILQKNKVDWK